MVSSWVCDMVIIMATATFCGVRLSELPAISTVIKNLFK